MFANAHTPEYTKILDIFLRMNIKRMARRLAGGCCNRRMCAGENRTRATPGQQSVVRSILRHGAVSHSTVTIAVPCHIAQ